MCFVQLCPIILEKTFLNIIYIKLDLTQKRNGRLYVEYYFAKEINGDITLAIIFLWH